MWTTCPERGQGFTLVSALFLLVVLSALGAAMARVATSQHLGAALELDGARALQTARAGLEWGTWQVMRNPAPPSAAPACFATTTLSPGGSLSGLVVSVQCTRTPTTGTVLDGTTGLVFFTLQATACNQPAAGVCPNPNPGDTYVERQLSWQVVR
ncbi:pilus assembly PilX family protein [Ideonella livida]|uniref:Agglutinin biogenesis protein MshP n=1 Tax=Ideonella livida TaxID=2707176 RepID=A0A7C9PES1_9BURK|nr:agglutinin biogenesis protein MshP [Ideonella livida]NDY89869.1 agglutinin biogenesis protein MshP [Ideonella livida]